jgi:proline dehydrogenase
LLRPFFIWLSQSKSLRAIAEKSSIGVRVSSRFVAGTTVEAALTATAVVNKSGCSVSLDSLGENVTNAEEAKRSADIYHRLLDEIAARGLNANVSVKLTQMGLDVDEGLARGITRGIVEHAARYDNFVRIDMEGSPYTERTLRMVRELHRMDGNAGRVGAVIQAYLYRSEKDVADLLSEGIRIRLCKGAYQEPSEIAFQKKADVDANYVRLMKVLLKSGVYHGIATHDPRMIAATRDFARAEKIPPDAFEFQMLYGIRRDLQQQLVKEGWRMRVYIPFGTEWYPYFMRRLAERPANVLFVLKNLWQ